MEEQKDSLRLLDMMTQPVFCVKENTIVKANAAAQQLFLMEGQELAPLLLTGAEEYAAFREGCLYLTLDIAGQPTEACVRKWEDMDIFDLNVQDQKLITLRYGLEGGKPLSPEETGRKLGLTPEEVVAAEAAALAKLRTR